MAQELPPLAAEILAKVLGVALPDYTEARIVSADLSEIQPHRRS